MYTGEKYFWWNDAQKNLADEVAEFADTIIASQIQEIEKTKKFPWHWFEEIGKRGWYGVFIPKEYGGMGTDIGYTGYCITLEEIARGAPIAVDFYETTLYGYSPIVRFGTEAQKQKYLPRLATGELFCAIVITEPFMGTDAANIQTTAVEDGDGFVINGKKRFITLGGISNLYLVYCKTSDDPEDRKKHRHLSAFIVEKGDPGFSVEAIHDPMGRFGSRHATLNFDNVRIPKENLVGNIGDGWGIVTDALNIERLGVAAGAIGTSRSALTATAEYTTRRVAFKQTLADVPGVQNMTGDMVTNISLMSLMVYYSAYLLDQGENAAMETTISKVYATENLMKNTLDAVQCHGGDGYMRNYPVERLMRDSKVIEMAAGANEVMKPLAWKLWLKKYQNLRKSGFKTITQSSISGAQVQDKVLEKLAEFYRQHPALYMEIEDMMEQLTITREDLEGPLLSLEKEKLVALYRGRKGEISLIKATYAGLKKAKPQDYYVFIPEFVNKEKETF